MANMDLMAFLSTFVLVATIATSIFAVAAYLVSRGYVRRRPRVAASLAGPDGPAAGRSGASGPILKRYVP